MARIYTKRNGHPLGQAISALQKDIRRGNEYEAMYWALELAPFFEVYLWKRLKVIVNEDIGIANPQLLMLVPIQAKVYMDFREEGRDGSARLVLANVILLMCRSPKTRIADTFQCVVAQDREKGKTIEIPDYALDKHTGAGKRMGRGVQHWREEGCILNPPSEIEDPYEDAAFDHWEDFIKTEWGKRKPRGKGNNDSEQLSLF